MMGLWVQEQNDDGAMGTRTNWWWGCGNMNKLVMRLREQKQIDNGLRVQEQIDDGAAGTRTNW
jgi:hypothetical protein